MSLKCYICGKEVSAQREGGDGYVTISADTSRTPVYHICNVCIDKHAGFLTKRAEAATKDS